MNRNTMITVVIAGSLLATPLFASNFFHKLMPGKKSVHAAPNLHAKPLSTHEIPNYTDFSGNWSGNCTFDDGSEILTTLAIENDDNHIELDGEELTIGPLHTKTTSDNLGETFDHTSIEWSNDMSMLHIKNVDFDKIHSLYPHNESYPLMTMISDLTLSLNNEQLVIKGQSVGLVDLEQSELNTITCTLSQK